MGTEESLPQRPPHHLEDGYVPVSGRQYNISSLPVKLSTDPTPFTSPAHGTHHHSKKLLQPAFRGIWSKQYPQSLSPIARAHHFTAFSEDFQKFYIGYGEDFTGNLLSDIWEFDLDTKCWHRLQLDGGELEPRKGCSAAIYGNHICVYGGQTASGYVSDLHLIDVSTLSVTLIEAEGPAPPPLVGAIVELAESRIFVWGGFNGEVQNSLFVLDTLAMEWRCIEPGVPGRYSIPWYTINEKVYAYGGASSQTLIVIDLTEESVREVTCTGAPPPAEAHGAGMCCFDNNIVYFGGQAQSKWSLVYCLDVSRMWWFVLHVAPDNETVSLNDGMVSEFGLFMVPRVHRFAVGYSKKSRTVIATLGCPMREPPPLFALDVGDAIGVIHLRDDMLNVLKATYAM